MTGRRNPEHVQVKLNTALEFARRSIQKQQERLEALAGHSRPEVGGSFTLTRAELEKLRQRRLVLRLANRVGVVVRAVFHQHEQLGLGGGVVEFAA
jgi:hypothetical protein